MDRIGNDPRRAAAVVVAVAISLIGVTAKAGSAHVERLLLRGASRTRVDTVTALLPRSPPAEYTDGELAELERRLRNLEIFDRVAVERRATDLVVTVREKWTLVPSAELSTATTLEDSYALLGLTEYNFLGTGNQLGASVYHEQRGWGAAVLFNEHGFRRRGWAFGSEAAYGTVQLRFDDGSGWTNTVAEWAGWVTSPPLFGRHLNYTTGLTYDLEMASNVVGGSAPPTMNAFGTFMGVTWDAYTWEDLVPRGIRFGLNLSAGLGLGPEVPLPRYKADGVVVAAAPLARYTVITARALAAASTRGSASFSYLIGSVNGVRGLEDTFYRAWIGSVANVELRQAVPIAERWAIQGVLFGDAATFEQITATGGRGDEGLAVSAGGGLRLVPTWLAALVLRVDVARLLLPEQRWFVQFGLSQYF